MVHASNLNELYIYIYVFDIMYGCRSSRVDSWIGQFRAHGIPISHFSATISWYPTSSRIICWLFWIAQSHLLGNLRSMPWSTPWTWVPDLLFAFDFQISNAASGVRDWCWPVAVLMMVDRAQSCWCQKFQTFDFARYGRYGTKMYKASWAQRSAAGCCLDLHRMWCFVIRFWFQMVLELPLRCIKKMGTAGTSACHWEEAFGHIWTKVPVSLNSPCHALAAAWRSGGRSNKKVWLFALCGASWNCFLRTYTVRLSMPFIWIRL